jgi:hypothetical protein
MLLIPQLIVFAITAYQDFKDRAISWFLPLCIFILGCIEFLGIEGQSLKEPLFSLVFLVIQMGIVFGYFSFKKKTFRINFTNELIGWGDLLFFVAMTPFFNLRTYLILFIAGLVFSLIGHQILNKIRPSASIPLAGWLSIFYSIYLITKAIF